MSTNVADAGTSGGSSAGDWTCGDSDCRHVNFARRNQCKQCQRERSDEGNSGPATGGSMTKKKLGTEIGKAAAEKSRGLFSAEDWQCSKCANVNWARRQTCNMCNAPKFCDVEERTGYGGGYNDRGIVEYKEREESDSEYDEFGRLKKKKKMEANTFSEPKKLRQDKEDVKTTNSSDEKDEDEEEDDDGDLSKYDLWGDDEIALIPKVGKNDRSSSDKEKTSKSSSRSSSTSSGSTSSNSSSQSTMTTSSTSTSRSCSQSDRSRPTHAGKNRITERRSSSTRQSGNRSTSPTPSSNSHTSTSIKLKDRHCSVTSGKSYTSRERSRSPRENYNSSRSSTARYRKKRRSRSVSSGKNY